MAWSASKLANINVYTSDISNIRFKNIVLFIIILSTYFQYTGKEVNYVLISALLNNILNFNDANKLMKKFWNTTLLSNKMCAYLFLSYRHTSTLSLRSHGIK